MCILYFVSHVLSGVYNCIFVCAAIWHNKKRISNSSRPSISVSITGLLRETKVLVLVLVLVTKVLVNITEAYYISLGLQFDGVRRCMLCEPK